MLLLIKPSFVRFTGGWFFAATGFSPGEGVMRNFFSEEGSPVFWDAPLEILLSFFLRGKTGIFEAEGKGSVSAKEGDQERVVMKMIQEVRVFQCFKLVLFIFASTFGSAGQHQMGIKIFFLIFLCFITTCFKDK